MNKKNMVLIGIASIAALTLAWCDTPTTTTTTTTVVTGTTQTTVTNSEIAGTITATEQGKDGVQLTIQGNDGQEYTTAVSIISDTITNGVLADLSIGTKVVVSVDEMAGNLIIGNAIEIK